MGKKYAIVATVAVFVLILILSTARSVGTSHVAVVTRFGDVTGVVVPEGFHFKAPWESYNMIYIGQDQVVGSYDAATSDQQSVTMDATIQIQVQPDRVIDLYRKFLGNHVQAIVAPNAASSFKAASASFTLPELIADRNHAQEVMLSNLRAALEPYGITVVSVQLSNLAYSDEYKAAIEAKMVAQQNLEKAQIDLEIARIEAQTNETIAASISDELLNKMIVEAWDGKLPSTYSGTGSPFGIIVGQ